MAVLIDSSGIDSPGIIFGVYEPKPIRNAPPGRQRLRIRNDDWVTLFVKNPTGIRKFLVVDKGDYWEVDYRFEQGANYRPSSES